MRKLIVSIHSTANNIVTGPPSGDETDFMQWAHPGIEESLHSLLASLSDVDTILLGRGTYEDLKRKWPYVAQWPDVSEVTSRIGHIVNTTPKLVATGTHPLDALEWGEFDPPDQLVGTDIEEQVARLKQAQLGDIITFGSPALIDSLTNAGLVDEYQILVHPVVVGEGRHLFEGLTDRTDLTLVGTEIFPGGALLITYARRS